MCIVSIVIGTSRVLFFSTGVLFQYPIRRLIIRSRKDSKPIDLQLDLFDPLKFDRHLGSTAAEVPVEFESDTTILKPAVSRLCEISRQDVLSDIETRPVSSWNPPGRCS